MELEYGQEADVGVGGGGGAAEEVAFCETVTTKLRKDYVGLGESAWNFGRVKGEIIPPLTKML